MCRSLASILSTLSRATTAITMVDMHGTTVITRYKISRDGEPIQSRFRSNFSPQDSMTNATACNQLTAPAIVNERRVSEERPTNLHETMEAKYVTVNASNPVVTQTIPRNKENDKIRKVDRTVDLDSGNEKTPLNCSNNCTHANNRDVHVPTGNMFEADNTQSTDTSKWPPNDSVVVMVTDTDATQFSNNTIQQSEINERFIAILDRTDIPFAPDVTNIFIRGHICGMPFQFLVDTGASVSAIHSKVYQQFPALASTAPLPLTIPSIRSVSGDTISVMGQVNVPFGIDTNHFPFQALVLDKMAYDVILGRDFLENYQAHIDLQNRVISLGTTQLSFVENGPRDSGTG